jgi:hypothetical protein
MPGMVSLFGAAEAGKLSVIMTRGGRIWLLQQLPQQPFGRALVSSASDQNIENDTGLVHGSPQPMLHTGDF